MKPRILVVDDEPDIRECLATELVNQGFDVAMAGSAEEFRQRAFESRPDLIILDIMLGDKDGPMVYQGLLNEGFDHNVPVVFLSGLAADCHLSPIMPGRTYSLYSKPFRLRDLVAGIRSMIAA